MLYIAYSSPFWWFRNPANQLIWQISDNLQGFIYIYIHIPGFLHWTINTMSFLGRGRIAVFIGSIVGYSWMMKRPPRNRSDVVSYENLKDIEWIQHKQKKQQLLPKSRWFTILEHENTTTFSNFEVHWELWLVPQPFGKFLIPAAAPSFNIYSLLLGKWVAETPTTTPVSELEKRSNFQSNSCGFTTSML